MRRGWCGLLRGCLSLVECEEIIANPDIQGAHDKNKEFIGNNCYNFTLNIVGEIFLAFTIIGRVSEGC